MRSFSASSTPTTSASLPEGEVLKLKWTSETRKPQWPKCDWEFWYFPDRETERHQWSSRKFSEDHRFILLMEETHAPVEVGSLSHYLQGLVHLRWCRISAIKNFGGELFPRQIASECQATGTKNLMYHIWRSLERLCRVTLLFIDVHSWIFTYHTKMHTIYTPSIPCPHITSRQTLPTCCIWSFWPLLVRCCRPNGLWTLRPVAHWRRPTSRLQTEPPFFSGCFFFFGLDDFFVGRFQLEEMVDLWLLKGMVWGDGLSGGWGCVLHLRDFRGKGWWCRGAGRCCGDL